MNLHVSFLVIFISLIIFVSIIFAPGLQVFASSSPYLLGENLIGEMTMVACLRVEGEVITKTIEEDPSQTIDVCKFGNSEYRIVRNENCFVERTGLGRDPESGQEYTFSDVCDVPLLCNSPYSWGDAGGDYFSSVLRITIQDEPFDVITSSDVAICTAEVFDPESKKISIAATGVPNREGSLNVTIPSELLFGDFKVLLDDNETDFSLGAQGNSTIMSIPMSFSEETGRTVEIIGTEVIPEFPAALLIGALCLVFAILATRKLPSIASVFGSTFQK